MEARLHEFVLSYYREFRSIPLNFDGFILLIAGCKELSGFVLDAINKCNSDLLSENIINSYSVREKEFARDIDFALLAMKSHDLRYKFISEVLAIMYGNLIGYYGDHETSYTFLSQIKGPNLYDRIYQ